MELTVKVWTTRLEKKYIDPLEPYLTQAYDKTTEAEPYTFYYHVNLFDGDQRIGFANGTIFDNDLILDSEEDIIDVADMIDQDVYDGMC